MMRLLIVACALDAFIFALVTFGNCRRGEYASSAAWSCRLSGKWQGRVFVPAIDKVFGWLGDIDHCRTSWHGQIHLYESTNQPAASSGFFTPEK